MIASAFDFLSKKLISWFNRMRKLSTGFQELIQELFFFNSITPCWPTKEALMSKQGKSN